LIGVASDCERTRAGVKGRVGYLANGAHRIEHFLHAARGVGVGERKDSRLFRLLCHRQPCVNSKPAARKLTVS